MIIDYFKLAIKNLKSRKIRSYLTIIGIFIGIAAVVALTSLGQGLQNAINDQFVKIGTQRIIISPAGAIAGPTSGGMSAAKLSEHDVSVVNKVDGVEHAFGMVSATAPVLFDDKIKFVTIMGMPLDTETLRVIDKVSFLEIEDGRSFRPTDSGYTAVVGYQVAHDFFDKEIKPGKKITINGVEFTVIGTQKSAGTFVHDIIIRIPIDTARDLFNKPDDVTTIFVKADDNAVPSEVADKIAEKLRKAHNVKEGEEDFSVQTAEQTIESYKLILDIVQMVVIGIAAISLLVGGIGIMNTMYTAVVERTKEIGIMKAIGATNQSVLLTFLIEAGTLGMVGGAIGVTIGLGISKLVEFIANLALGSSILAVQITPLLVFGSLAFSFLIGAVSGAIPAWQASRLNPVEALRYE